MPTTTPKNVLTPTRASNRKATKEKTEKSFKMWELRTGGRRDTRFLPNGADHATSSTPSFKSKVASPPSFIVGGKENNANGPISEQFNRDSTQAKEESPMRSGNDYQKQNAVEDHREDDEDMSGAVVIVQGDVNVSNFEDETNDFRLVASAPSYDDEQETVFYSAIRGVLNNDPEEEMESTKSQCFDMKSEIVDEMFNIDSLAHGFILDATQSLHELESGHYLDGGENSHDDTVSIFVADASTPQTSFRALIKVPVTTEGGGDERKSQSCTGSGEIPEQREVYSSPQANGVESGNRQLDSYERGGSIESARARAAEGVFASPAAVDHSAQAGPALPTVRSSKGVQRSDNISDTEKTAGNDCGVCDREKEGEDSIRSDAPSATEDTRGIFDRTDKAEEIERLQNRVKFLENKLIITEQERDDAEAQARAVEELYQERHISLCEQNKNLRHELDNVASYNESAFQDKKTVLKLRSSIKTITAERDELMARTRSWESRYNDAVSSAKTTKANLIYWKNQAQQNSADCRKLQSQMKKSDAEYLTLREERHILHRANSELEKQCSTIKDEKDALDVHLKENGARIEALEKEKGELKAVNYECSVKVDRLAARANNHLNGQKNIIQCEKNALERLLKQRDAQLKALEEAKAFLEERRDGTAFLEEETIACEELRVAQLDPIWDF